MPRKFMIIRYLTVHLSGSIYFKTFNINMIKKTLINHHQKYYVLVGNYLPKTLLVSFIKYAFESPSN
jgi:hypothetical protein